MKKIILFFCLALTLLCLLCACNKDADAPDPDGDTPPLEHVHTFGEWQQSKASTCTQKGTKIRTCECGESESEDLPLSPHKWGEWTITKLATYTEAGHKTRACECGEASQSPIPPLERPAEGTVLIENGTTEYVLVRDYKASNAVINAVNSMVNSIKANIGADITIKDCFNDLEDEPLDVVTEKEILIGMTNRPESIEALDGMRSKDYTVSNHGTKLVIGGGGEEGTIAAILYFIQLICEQGNSHAVSDGALLDLTFATENETVFRDQYSYDSVTLLGTSISSFGLIYPKHADNSTECKELAAQIAAHVSNESGYELKTYKDTRYWCDYEILIGDTIRTDDDLVDSLGKDEYYIRLIKTEVTYEDDSKHPGGQLIICFGEDAADDALEAFKTLVLPPQDTPTDLTLQNEFELTNRNT